MKIIPYDAAYRDNMIFMVLEAKNALGRVPHRAVGTTIGRPPSAPRRRDDHWSSAIRTAP